MRLEMDGKTRVHAVVAVVISGRVVIPSPWKRGMEEGEEGAEGADGAAGGGGSGGGRGPNGPTAPGGPAGPEEREGTQVSTAG